MIPVQLHRHGLMMEPESDKPLKAAGILHVLAPVHRGTPVMLNDNDALTWLTSDGDEISNALNFVRRFSADLMEGYDVSKIVNSPSNDNADCIQPA
jgi:putative SOS response-associated peptidase YedK